ncbi:protein phosphatase 2C [Dendrothele bispora CBS 962.96]|uniref:Protein phosphatase 2C n=1 Tax=Dendrothele bispora (strain CBS 962.96) TaxID=1314807 RepID=A0A4S8MQH1_DENBC|nr:protein phosphatase 2C [Dendrothele bispora CBS 962.96]
MHSDTTTTTGVDNGSDSISTTSLPPSASSQLLAMPRNGFTSSPNARSKSITTTDLDTNGVLNRHATKNTSYQIGVSEDKGSRRTMEDTHAFVVDFDHIRGQLFAGVFDGHAGIHAADACGHHFHEYLLKSLKESPDMTVPDILNKTYHEMDAALSRMCEESDGKIHSGCTAVTAFLRIEDAEGKQSFLDNLSSPVTAESPKSEQATNSNQDEPNSPHESSAESGDDLGKDHKGSKSKKSTSNRIKKALRSLGSGTLSGSLSPKTPKSGSPTISRRPSAENIHIRVPPEGARRVLYCANVGDARGVLCRKGKAVRLTYDHKGSDKQEAKRITDAGGFVMSGRVNGVLAVTRSLGDSSMKEFVVGAPYTTETELCDDDECLILACDGLWDVISDQAAVDLIRDTPDPQLASTRLMKYALSHHTTDNVTVEVIRFKKQKP